MQEAFLRGSADERGANEVAAAIAGVCSTTEGPLLGRSTRAAGVDEESLRSAQDLTDHVLGDLCCGTPGVNSVVMEWLCDEDGAQSGYIALIQHR